MSVRLGVVITRKDHCHFFIAFKFVKKNGSEIHDYKMYYKHCASYSEMILAKAALVSIP